VDRPAAIREQEMNTISVISANGSPGLTNTR
jgi:hypothetical protein